MIYLNEKNWDREVESSLELVMVSFWCPDCAPGLLSEIISLSRKYEGHIKFGAIRAEDYRNLVASQIAWGLPAVAFYYRGEKVGELAGDFTAGEIREKIDEVLQFCA